jgi:predicted Zn finger-like uncharacterized protein
MYTQCPDCQTAFRVTARVLQQAAGRVRCGGCGSAFNALDFLSEELPAAKDDTSGPDAGSDADLRNRKLLETLDQLAGDENVIIEDTGVEWQVLEEPDDEATGRHSIGDTGTMRWTIEDVADDAEAVPEIVDEVPLDSADDSVMRFDDNTPLPEDFDEVVTTSANVPHRRHQDLVEHESRHFDEMQIDLALGEPEEWVDLLDEVDEFDADGSVAEPGISLEVEEELAAIHSELTSRPAGRRERTAIHDQPSPEPQDVEAQFDSQAEALGLETTGSRARPVDIEDDTGSALRAQRLESTGEFEEQIELARAALAAEDADSEPQGEEETGEYPLALDEEHSTGGEQHADHSDTDTPDLADQEFDADIDEDAFAELVLRGELQAATVSEHSADDIQQEDDVDVVPTESAEPATTAKKSGYPDHLFDENADNVETIIMEGDFVHASLHEEMQEARNKADNIDQAAFLADTYSLSRNKIRGGRRKSDPAGFGRIAAIVVLGLLLTAQGVHKYRQVLSTYGAFNQTIAPIYRLAGMPITPEWDIRGWQFQTTSGSTDDSEQVLTIVSTVVNRSSLPLPYPLVHVSLTDRWEEIIGSRVLEPNEYLAGDLDPSRPVAPGEKFTAVISINSPSPDATGFKLNVCYRVSPGLVRCATEDFKD